MRHLLLLCLLLISLPSKGQIQKQRLIGHTWRDYSNFVVATRDSTVYKYSGLNGSDMLTREYKFDTSWFYHMIVPSNNMRIMQTYDTGGLLQVRTEQFWNTTTMDYFNTTKHRYYYNAMSTLDSEWRDIWNTTTMVWVPSYLDKYIYNSNNELVQFLQGTSTRYNYTYSSGNMIQMDHEVNNGSWIPYETYFYSYDGSNRLITSFGRRWHNIDQAWDTLDRQEYTYYGNGALQSKTVLEWKPVTHTWAGYHRNNYVYDNNGLLSIDSIEAISTAGVPRNTQKIVWHNNSFSNPDSTTPYIWDLSGSYWKAPQNGPSQEKFYYEIYNVPGHVGNISALKHFSIFPSPATNFINISLEWEKQTGSNIAIYSMDGRMVLSWNLEPARKLDRVLPLPALPAGTYIIKVTGGDAALSRRFTVIQ